MSGARRSHALTAAFGLGVLATATLASGGHGAGARASAGGARTAADVAAVLVAVLGGAAVVVTALSLPRPQRRPKEQQFVAPLRGRWALLATAAGLVLAGAIALLVIDLTGQRGVRPRTLPHLAAPAPAVTPTPARGRAGGPPAWLWLAAGLAGAAVAAGLLVPGLERRPAPARRRRPGHQAAPAASAEPDGAWPEDPREAVLAAYSRGEHRLERAGLGRRAAEGPRELRDRVRGAPEVDADAAFGLTDLYERAQFSRALVSAAMAAQARAAAGRLVRETSR